MEESFRYTINLALNGLAVKVISQYRREILWKGKQVKAEIIGLFENHPITEAIKEGEGGSSDFTKGYGDLFSFLGLSAGEDHIGPVLDLFYNMDVVVKRDGNNLTAFIDKVPSKEAIFAITPFQEWNDGRSWMEAIERGVSGLSYYISGVNKGRSGGGIQAKSVVANRGAYKAQKYISSILRQADTLIKKEFSF